MRWISRTLVTALVGGLAALAFMTAAPHAGQGAGIEAVAEEEPGYAVEDFAYPQADEILAERGFLLKSGDGHIVLADCGPAGLLEIWARDQGDRICFRVTGDSGHLSLELPAVYAIRGNDYTSTADMTVDGEETSFDVPPNTWTPVGESADPEGREHMLVEITATR